MSSRLPIALCLATFLALTSMALGAARGQATPASTVVICTEGGTTLLPLDGRGEPVVQDHSCPDCAGTALALLPAPCLALFRRASPVEMAWPRDAGDPAGRRIAGPVARGPPGGA